MSRSNQYKPRQSHPTNGLSLIPQHVLAPVNASSPISRPAIDPFKAFTARDLDSFVDNITNKIRNALLGSNNTSTDDPPATYSTRSIKSSDVFGKPQSIHSSTRASPSGPSSSQFQIQPLDDRNRTYHSDYHDEQDLHPNEDVLNHQNDDPRVASSIHPSTPQAEINRDETILISSPLNSPLSSQVVPAVHRSNHNIPQSETDYTSSESDSNSENSSGFSHQADSASENEESSDDHDSQQLDHQTGLASFDNSSSQEHDSDELFSIDQSTHLQEVSSPIQSSSPSQSQQTSSRSESRDLDESSSSQVTDEEVASSSVGSIELASNSPSIIFESIPSNPNGQRSSSPVGRDFNPARVEQQDDDDLDLDDDGDIDIDGFEEDSEEMEIREYNRLQENDEDTEEEQVTEEDEDTEEEEEEDTGEDEEADNIENEKRAEEEERELDINTQPEDAGEDLTLEEENIQIESLIETRTAPRSPHALHEPMASQSPPPSSERSENQQQIITIPDLGDGTKHPLDVQPGTGDAPADRSDHDPIHKNEEDHPTDANDNQQPSSSCPPTTRTTIQLITFQDVESTVHLQKEIVHPTADPLINHDLSSQSIPVSNSINHDEINHHEETNNHEEVNNHEKINDHEELNNHEEVNNHQETNNHDEINNHAEKPSSLNPIVMPEKIQVKKDELVTCSTFNFLAPQSASTNSSEMDPQLPIIEEQMVEDDNDLFEGDNDLRLHNLGVNHQISNQNQNNVSGEIQDRFSSIEQRLESFLNASSNHNDSIEDESWVEKTVCQDHHSMILKSNLTDPTKNDVQLIPPETQPVSETNGPIADAVAPVSETHRPKPDAAAPVSEYNGPIPDAVSPLAIFQRPQSLLITDATAKSKISNDVASTEQTCEIEVGALHTSHVEPAQPPSSLIWGDLPPPETLIDSETFMKEVDFFPVNNLSQSEEKSNSAGWIPALSDNISIDHKGMNPQPPDAPTVSLKLPQPPTFRQTFNLDDDLASITEDTKEYFSKNLKHAQPHEPEDLDMLASSITDGDSDVAAAHSKKNNHVSKDKGQQECSKAEVSTLTTTEETHEEKLQDPKPLVNDETAICEKHADNHPSERSSKLALLSCESPVDPPSPPKSIHSLSDQSDGLLAQFLESNPDDSDDRNMNDLTVSVSPVASVIPASAVTFAASPPTEMDDNHNRLILAFAPQTPLTSTTQGRGTSSESSGRFMSRGSASLVTYSAPSSVVSSDAPSVPASSAPPPPLPNASMGAPTEAVGLSNQITRRSSVDSSTNAEPPSPSTSTRQRSAPITQEQVNAPGLPHVEVIEVASSPQNDLPDPLRSPPLMNQHLISDVPQPITISTSRASSMVAHPPSPAFPTEGSSTGSGLRLQDPSPPSDPRVQLPDPHAAPVPVSIPEIKLDLPIACSSIERNPPENSSSASQAATSPKMEKSILPTVPPSPKHTDLLNEKNLQKVDQINSSNVNVPSPNRPPSPTLNLSAPHLDQDPTISPPNHREIVDRTDEHVNISLENQSTECIPSRHEESPKISSEVPLKTSRRNGKTPDPILPCVEGAVDPLNVQPDSKAVAATEKVEEHSGDLGLDSITDAVAGPSCSAVTTGNERKKPIESEGPTYHARAEDIEAKDGEEVDRESQLREILRQRRASNQRALRTVPEPKNPKKRKTKSTDAKKKSKVVKRARSGSKGDMNSDSEVRSNLGSDATTEVELKETPVRSSLPRAAKRLSNVSHNLAPPGGSRSPSNVTTRSTSSLRFPSSPPNLNLPEKGSNQPSERGDRSLIAGTAPRSSRSPQPSGSSAVLPSSSVSVVVPPLKLEDAIPKLRLHQHNSKGTFMASQLDGQQGVGTSKHSTDDTESKPALGRGSRRKQSDIHEARQLPASLPPVTRSHCHFIRLKFNNNSNDDSKKSSENSNQIIDTFLIPQCATGNEEIKNKMKALDIIEEDNLTAEEQNRGIRIGHDGKKHSFERFEHSHFNLCLKEEYLNFSVDENTLNILIELVGLSLIQEGQVEALLPENYFKKKSVDLNNDHHQEETNSNHHYLSIKKRQRTRSFDSSSSLQQRSRKSSPAFLIANTSNHPTPKSNKRRKSHNPDFR